MRCVATVLMAGLVAGIPHTASAASDSEIERAVADAIRNYIPASMPVAVAVAVRDNGRILFFNHGVADRSTKAPVTSDSLFNLGSVGKVIDTALLAQAARAGELSLDDAVAKHVVELQNGGDIRRVTLRQLASYTSGFVLPQDLPPWPERFFTLPQFIATLNRWKADENHEPGRQMIYSHAGFVLLHLALERRFGIPYGQLVEQRMLKQLGLASTTLPVASTNPKANPRGELPPAFARRAVQGYSAEDNPIGKRGELQGFYLWLGTGQMYSSARDLAVFLTAALGEMSDQRALYDAVRLSQQGVLRVGGEFSQALAWEVRNEDETIVDKYGGLNNATAYIGMIHERKIGIVILANRGSLGLDTMGRAVMSGLARAGAR